MEWYAWDIGCESLLIQEEKVGLMFTTLRSSIRVAVETLKISKHHFNRWSHNQLMTWRVAAAGLLWTGATSRVKNPAGNAPLGIHGTAVRFICVKILKWGINENNGWRKKAEPIAGISSPSSLNPLSFPFHCHIRCALHPLWKAFTEQQDGVDINWKGSTFSI